MPETALDRGREFVLSAERMALEPATRVSPQSPSPATKSQFTICWGGGPMVSYFVISGSALMRALAAPWRSLVNVVGSAATCATFVWSSSGGEVMRLRIPERFHAVTFPDHPSAVVFASKAAKTVVESFNLDTLSNVNDTPGPFNAVIKVPM